MDEKVRVYLSLAVFISISTLCITFSIPTLPNVLQASKEGFFRTDGKAPVALIKFNGEIVNGGNVLVTAGSEIELDASGSYDPDGTIKSYEWLMGGNLTRYGKKLSLKIDDINNPITFYPVVLFVYDNSLPYSRIGSAFVLLEVKASELFLSKEGLALKKPYPDKEKIVFLGKKSILYRISSASIPVSSVKVYLHIEKPLLSVIKKISVFCIDSDMEKHLLEEKKDLGGFWREKVIELEGNYNGDLRGVELVFHGFSLRGISLIYGGDEPSVVKLS